MAGVDIERSAAVINKSSDRNTSRNKDNKGNNLVVKALNMSGSLIGSYSMVKLNHANFLLRKNMVLLVIRGNKLEGYITGAKICAPEFTEETKQRIEYVQVTTNLEFEDWFAQDQMLLGWIYNTIEPVVASELMGYETSQQLWTAINNLFGVKQDPMLCFTKGSL